MIVPDEVLGIMAAVHPDVVEAEAHEVKKAAGGFRDTGAAVHSAWQGLSAFYTAPEAADLFAATGPVRDDSASLAGQVEQVAGALTAYAAETRVIKRRLTDLYMRSVTFVNKTYAEDGEWLGNEDLVNENNALLQQVNAQALAFQKAQEKAAGCIHAAYGGSLPARKPGGGGKPPPWGSVEEADLPWWQDLWNGATSLFAGFFQDGLWGDLTGMWELATSPSKWGEAYLNVMALGLPFIPVVGQAVMGIPSVRTKVGEQWKDLGKSFVAWDRWKDDPARALGATAYNVLTTIVPIGKAGSVGKLAKSTRAASKAGEALDPLGLALRAGGKLGKLPKVSDFAARFGDKFGRLPGKLGLDLGRARVITPSPTRPPSSGNAHRPPRPRSPDPADVPDPSRTLDTGDPSRTPDTDTPATRPDDPDPTTPNTPNTRDPAAAPETAAVPDYVPEWVTRQHHDVPEQVQTSHERAPELVGAHPTEITNSADGPSDPPSHEPTNSPTTDSAPHTQPIDSGSTGGPASGSFGDPPSASFGSAPGLGGMEPIPGHLDSDGIRRFDSDADGEAYGERHLGEQYRNLPENESHAIREYTRHSWPYNPHLRGVEEIEKSLNDWWDDIGPGWPLFEMNGGRPPSIDDVRAAAGRSDLSLRQQLLVDAVMQSPDPVKKLESWMRSAGHRGLVAKSFDGFPTTADIDERIRLLDRALNKRIPEGVQVHRGLHGVKFLDGYDGDVNNLIGQVQTDKGYLSTSVGKTVTSPDERSYFIVMHMDVPAGSNGLWVGRESAYPTQRELILPRNTRYLIEDAYWKDGKVHLDAKILETPVNNGLQP